MKTLIALAVGALLPLGGSALAQEIAEPANPLDPAHMDKEAEAETPAAQFTDAQIAGFVEAAMAIRTMRDDTSMDDETRHAEALAIVAQNGLDPDTYSAIGVAAQSDPAVAQRVQLAIAARDDSGDS